MNINKYLRIERPHIIIILLICVGALLRLYQLGDKSFWTDELVTIANAIKLTDINVLFAHTREDDLPKFYSLVLRFWLMFGDSEFATRSLSVLFGCAAIPVAYAICRLFFDVKTSISAALLTAISPFLLLYDREVRMYSLFSLLSLLSTYYFIRAIRGNEKSHWFFYVVVNVLNLYTHYYALLTIGVQWLFLIIHNRNYRHVIMPWFIVNGIIFIFFAVRLAAFISDVLYFAPWAIPRERFPFIVGKEFVEFFYILFSISAGQTILPWNPIAPLVFIAAMGCLFYAAKKVKLSQDGLYLMLLMFVPILVGLAFRISMPRYFIFLAPVFYMFIARGFWLIPMRGLIIAVIIIFIGGWGYSASNYYRNKEFHIMAHIDPWREAAVFLKENVEKNEEIFTIGLGVVPLRYYYGQPIKGFQEKEVMQEIKKTAELGTKRIWLIFTFPEEYDNWLNAREFLLANYTVIKKENWARDPDFETKKRFFKKNFSPYRIVAELFERKTQIN